ncbi:MAG: PilN domain-containing protein [Chromatiales bacterium]|jgi:Tfp pilus assembly protein PilN
MKYRLNLYTERFRPRQILLNRWLLCASVGLLFMTLLVAGFALGMSNAELAQRYHSSRDSQETLQSRLVSLSRQIDGDARKQVLRDKIAAQSRAIAGKQRVLEQLADRPLLTESRFSQFMQGLSNSHVQGLWLTRVRADGNNLELNGSSLSEELLPQWLRRLSRQTDFRGRKFGALELIRPPDSQMSRLDFHLSTELQQADDRNG